jgi:hypothetical protein
LEGVTGASNLIDSRGTDLPVFSIRGADHGAAASSAIKSSANTPYRGVDESPATNLQIFMKKVYQVS